MNLLLNLIPVIGGWFVWNFAELVIEQRSLDEDGNPQTNFSFEDFKKKKKYLWIGSLGMCPLILWIGYKGLSLDILEPIVGVNLGWNELYLLGSGAGFELLIFIIVKVKNIFAKLGKQ